MAKANVAERIRKIETLVGEDIGGRRGMGPLLDFARGGLLAAAQSIAAAKRPHLAIISGFYQWMSQPPNCETDGPPGAAHLAAAFHHAGIPCRLVTDMANANSMYAAAWGAGLPGTFPFDVASMNDQGTDGGVPVDRILAAWKKLRPKLTHVISIERCGPSKDGTPRNFRGKDISQWNAPLDKLFTGGAWTTIGIGDGGNELGMGNLPAELVAKHVPQGDEVASVTKCDHLIICGVSNWGGWALPAALALLMPKLKAKLTKTLNKQMDKQILDVCVKKGLGTSPDTWGGVPYPCMYVDSLPWAVHGRKLDQIMRVAG
ncbi:MAG: glutamate cyclase domain-containing protein [Pseudomonadota bacterium]